MQALCCINQRSVLENFNSTVTKSLFCLAIHLWRYNPVSPNIVQHKADTDTDPIQINTQNITRNNNIYTALNFLTRSKD